MSNPLPKERQTAYERWELASFGDNRSAAVAAEQAKVDAISQAVVDREIEDRVQHMVAERLLALRDEAHAEGFAAGRIEGRELATAEGRIDTAREAQAMREIAVAFGHEVAGANELMGQDMLNLAMDLAKAMVKSALEIRPELILPIVGNAIHHLPSVQQPAQVFLHPLDAAVVREHMQTELTEFGWRVAEDMELARGGCRVETASNQIDASLQTRWHRLAEALGQQDEWLLK